MAETLAAHHDTTLATVPVGYCCDVSHGHADMSGRVQHSNMELLATALPYCREIHLKNTDHQFGSTFGFGERDRERGIVDISAVVRLIVSNADRLPTRRLIGYFEIGGPKLGRDYSDYRLEQQLRESLRYLKEVFGN